MSLSTNYGHRLRTTSNVCVSRRLASARLRMGSGPTGNGSLGGGTNACLFVGWVIVPTLEEYVGRIAARYPDLTIQPEAHPELDLISMVSKREPERRRLLAEAKKMGFNNECVWALYMYTGHTLYHRTKSLKEAQEYMATIDEEVLTTALADQHR
ncbi:MAG: hypothetical protein WBX38_11330 [Candidatus Sulfotelmatobacter sp.]